MSKAKSTKAEVDRILGGASKTEDAYSSGDEAATGGAVNGSAGPKKEIKKRAPARFKLDAEGNKVPVAPKKDKKRPGETFYLQLMKKLADVDLKIANELKSKQSGGWAKNGLKSMRKDYWEFCRKFELEYYDLQTDADGRSPRMLFQGVMP